MPEPLTLFVYEHLTSGACREVPITSSLMLEGRAMVDGVIEDFASLASVNVVTLRDERIPELKISGVTSYCVDSSNAMPEMFQSCCSIADRMMVIAPESNRILQDRLLGSGTRSGVRVINCLDSALDVGSDKWKLAQFCRFSGISHILTELWQGQELPFSGAMIIKPRDGAGGEQVVLVQDGAVPAAMRTDGRLIVQPLIDGVALSSAACFSSEGELLLTLPLGEQHVNISDTVDYQGGTIPWNATKSQEANRQATEVWAVLEKSLDGLSGYVGIDWIWEEETETLCLVEINPRLTTAYVGYRQLFGNKLAKAMLEMPCTLDSTACQQVSFTAVGGVSLSGQTMGQS